jgi:general secretion pathway protein E
MSSDTAPQSPDRDGLRPALSLEELLEILVRRKLVTSDASKDVQARATTLRSRVVKDRVGSVRSQAAARYVVTPAEIVAEAGLPHPGQKHGVIHEDAIAKLLAEEAGRPYHKIDPLQVDNDLVTKTLSRPFARHHVVIPLHRDADGLCLTAIDPFDGALRETLENLIPEPLNFVVSTKADVLKVIDRVYGFRSSVTRAEAELGPGVQTGKLVQMVEVKTGDELSNSDEHVVAAVDYLLNYAYEQRASGTSISNRAPRTR